MGGAARKCGMRRFGAGLPTAFFWFSVSGLAGKKEETTCIGNGNSGEHSNQKDNNLK